MAVCCALELRRNISSRQISICLILFFSFSPTGSGAHPPPPAERGRMAVGSETDTNCRTPAELHTHATRGGCINRPVWSPPRPRRVPRCWDSTLVAWYRSLYAPRTGGAYDSQNRTAGIAGCTRRRGGGVAADGACAEPAMPVVGFAFALGRALDSISALSARTRELGNSNGYPQKFASCLFSTNFVQPVRQCRMVTECENDQDHCSVPARWERYNTGSPAC